jgi:hypothetical protein
MSRLVPGSAGDGQDGGFEVGYVAQDGTERRITLTDAGQTRFEWCRRARRFPQYKGQRHFPGLWWTATMGCHVGSSPGSNATISCCWTSIRPGSRWRRNRFGCSGGQSRARSGHTHRITSRLARGGAVVVDCRPAERIKPRDAAAFAATRLACEQLGWRYRVSGTPEPISTRNIRWLAGYRHPRHDLPAVAAALREVFAPHVALMAGAEMVGDPEVRSDFLRGGAGPSVAVKVAFVDSQKEQHGVQPVLQALEDTQHAVLPRTNPRHCRRSPAGRR